MGETVEVFGPEPNFLELFRGAVVRLQARREVVHDEGLGENVFDQHPGIQRGERVLEDGLEEPPEGLHRPPAEPGHRVPADQLLDGAVVLPPGRTVGPDPLVHRFRDVEQHVSLRWLDEAQQEATEGRLPAAALANQSDGLAAANREVDAIDGPYLGDRPLEDSTLDVEMFSKAASRKEHLVPDPIGLRHAPPPRHTDGRRPSGSGGRLGVWAPRPDTARRRTCIADESDTQPEGPGGRERSLGS